MNNKLDEHVAAYQGENIYDFDNEILLNWYPKRIFRLAGSAKSLLELGLGHGFTAETFSKRFQRHVILEGSPAVIKNFREKHSLCAAEINECFFETFESDEKFDLIVMGFILEHVDDPVEILRRFRSFLASNGRLFVAVPNAEVLNRRIGKVAGLLSDMTMLSENDRLLGHKRYYTVRSLEFDVRAAGCRINRLEGIYLKPFTTAQMISLQLDKPVIDALCEIGIGYPELSCGILAEIVTG